MSADTALSGVPGRGYPASGLALLLAASLAARLPAQQAAPAARPPADTIVPFPQEIGTLRPGVLHNGRLQAGDWTMGDDPSWADVWYFEGTSGQRVQIDLRSRDFDCYLQLLDAAGNVLSDNDDGAGGKDSRVTVTLRTSQRYQVVANTYGDSPRPGSYTLLLTVLPAGR